jgi:putrescine:ornithine antiporter
MLRPGPLLLLLVCFATAADAQFLQTGPRLTIGYHPDARPFTFENESGTPVGYGIELCRQVAALAKDSLGPGAADPEFVHVDPHNRLGLLRDGKVQLLCGEPVTLSARQAAALSIPVYPGNVGALLRVDAPQAVTKALADRLGGAPWASAPAQDPLQSQILAVVDGSPTQDALASRLAQLQLSAKVATVKSYADGLQAILDRKALIFFADRSVLRAAVKANPSFDQLKIVERRLSLAPVAIALPRGNEDARLAVDRALSTIYRKPEFRALYTKWFGAPDADTVAFFRQAALSN